MKEALQKALEMTDGRTESGTDWVLAQSFFRSRPLQLGSQPLGGSARVIRLQDRRPPAER